MNSLSPSLPTAAPPNFVWLLLLLLLFSFEGRREGGKPRPPPARKKRMALKIKCSSSEKLPHQVLCGGVRSSQVADRGVTEQSRREREESCFFFISRIVLPPYPSSSAGMNSARETGWNVAQMLFSATATVGGEEGEARGNRWQGAAYITIAHCTALLPLGER